MHWSGLDEPRLRAAARALGARLRPGDVVLLRGPMGSGKTTFTRALAEGLDVERPQRVRSPTYNICLVHPGPRPLVHVDLFRLAGDDEPEAGSVSAAAFEALGLEAMVDGPADSVLVVEWSELWADPPPEVLVVELVPDPGASERRGLRVHAVGDRPREVLAGWSDEIGS